MSVCKKWFLIDEKDENQGTIMVKTPVIIKAFIETNRRKSVLSGHKWNRTIYMIINWQIVAF